MRDIRPHHQPRYSRSESHPTPAELAIRVGLAMLVALFVALLAQWAAGAP
jgi:hypothetical protein